MFVNRKYNLQMEVISPLHVGAASEKHFKEGLDYFYDQSKRKVVFINHQYAVKSNAYGEYLSHLLNANYDGIKKLAQRDNQFKSRSISLNDKPGSTIKAHLRNGFGKPVVPGSSIKGALRSVLFKHLRKENDSDNESVFGSLNQNNDFMRFVRVGDAEFEKTDLVNAKIFNLHKNNGEWQGGWKHQARQTDNQFKESGFTTTFETIPIGATSTFSLMLSNVLFNLLYSGQNGHIHPPASYNRQREIVEHEDPIGFLFAIINRQTKDYLKAEIKFFERFNEADNADLILDNLDYLMSLTDVSESCLFRMASGSGFHGITGNWQRPIHFSTVERPLNGKLYKSRRISFYRNEDGLVMRPMGYVLLTRLND